MNVAFIAKSQVLRTMLESQKDRIYERTRMQHKGVPEEEIERLLFADRRPFKPAFVNGKRRPRETIDHDFPGGQFACRQ